jgi:hypothetical protein
LKAGRGCCILKWDIKDAFRNIPVAPSQHWLLGFPMAGVLLSRDRALVRTQDRPRTL